PLARLRRLDRLRARGTARGRRGLRAALVLRAGQHRAHREGPRRLWRQPAMVGFRRLLVHRRVRGDGDRHEDRRHAHLHQRARPGAGAARGYGSVRMSMNRCSLAIVAAALCATPALAQPWHLTVTPSSPTWKDRVTIRVEGTTPGGCEAHVAAPTRTHFGGEQFRLDIPLLLDCAFPSNTESPLVADVDAGNLDPAQYQLRLRSDGETLEELVFEVFEAGEVQLVLPAL